MVKLSSFIFKEPKPKEEVSVENTNTTMGGGGVMRAAANIAGIGGVVQSGLRGSQSVSPVEQAVRKASFPALAATALSSSVNASTDEVSPFKKSSSLDLEDWEFAGGEDELVMSAGEPMPRVVFAGVPTFEEAKEATSELKEALDKVYLSNNECSESKEPSAADKVCAMPISSDSDSETKPCIVSETAITPSVPKHALQAFRMLSKNNDAQNVVASIASDPNVWNAVMQNSAVKEFFESQQKTSSEVHLLEYQGPETSGKFEDSSGAKQSGDFEDVLKDLLQNIKLTVVAMVSNVKSKIFGLFSDPSGDPKSAHMDRTTLGASFMGLAIMSIIVILMKRA